MNKAKIARFVSASTIPVGIIATVLITVFGPGTASLSGAPQSSHSEISTFTGHDLTKDKNIPMFSIPVYPGYSESHCVTLTAKSDDEATLKFYAPMSVNTKQLGENITLIVEAGSGGADGQQSCTDFVSEQVLYSGAASALGTSHGTAQTGLSVTKPLPANGSQQFMITATTSPDLPNESQGGLFDMSYGWSAQGNPR